MSLLPGSLTSERAKFWLSPTITPSTKADSTAARVCALGNGEGEGLDALVFAVAAIGVGIEVADERALDSRACGPSRCVDLTSGRVFRESEDHLANAARLGIANGGSGGVTHAVNCDFGEIAEADEKQALSGEACGSVQQDRLVRPRFEFARSKDGGGGCLHGRICGEQSGLRLGFRAFLCLGVGSKDGEKLGSDLGAGRKGKFSAHEVHC